MLLRSLTPLLLLFGLNTASAQTRLEALVETKRFHSPGKVAQVDVDMAVLGYSTLVAPNGKGVKQARVEAITVVELGDSVVDFRKTEVFGPETGDSLSADFVHQEHFLLEPGHYALSVELRDLNAKDTVHVGYALPLYVPEASTGITFSDVQLMETTAEGKAVPYPGSYFAETNDQLAFYAELYGTEANLGKDSLLLFTYQLENFETKDVRGLFKRVQRMRTAPVLELKGGFPIEELPSGNYLLALEVLDRKGQRLARQEQFIQRNNPIAYATGSNHTFGPNFTDAFTDGDTLSEYLASMRPIADDLERRIIDDQGQRKDVETMQRFMYTFWYNRNGLDPEGAWRRYAEAVKEVNRMFGCRNIRGYASDQGYVYLKYGAPNTVVDRSNETSSIPYYIWHYYQAGRYRDKRFVFWQPERATTCWQLLHSEVPGEMKNPRWNDMLHQTDKPWSVQGSGAGTIGGQEAQELFNNPR
ncbi:MAG TPA: GWxTD domain-containing protein [Flavobacteriales bacterium]